jgi:hypothetical protein
MRIDLALDADGDLPLVPRHITGIPLVLQRIRRRLRVFAGEWVLNTSQGLPYLAWRQTKPAPTEAIAARIRVELEQTPGVVRIDSCAASLDVATRTVRISARGVVEDPDTGELASVAIGVDDVGGSSTPALISITILSGGGVIP